MPDEWKAQWEAFADIWVKEMEWYCEEYFIPGFKLSVKKYDWDVKRKSSRGGYYASGPGINIAMNILSYRGGINRMYEYSSFDADPVIGGFYSYGGSCVMRMILAHEIAHAVQRTWDRMKEQRSKPHGEEFKKYYKALRWEFVNKHLPDQVQAKADYDRLKAEITGQS